MPPASTSSDPALLAGLADALNQLTPEQITEFKAGRLILTPMLASMLAVRLGLASVPVPEGAVSVPDVPPADNEAAAWLQSQDVYDAARDKAEAKGASPANLNALLQPPSLTLPCGLTMLPLTLSGYIFLEAVQNPFVTGGGAAAPTDLLLLAVALTVPEKAAALIRFDEDFSPSIKDPDAFTKLVNETGAKVTAVDVPPLMAHATAQFQLMFPPRAKESEGSDPLKETAAARAS